MSYAWAKELWLNMQVYLSISFLETEYMALVDWIKISVPNSYKDTNFKKDPKKDGEYNCLNDVIEN